MNAQHRARVRGAERELSSALGLTTEQVHTERAERSGTKHQQALQALGITDGQNKIRTVDAAGNLDLGAVERDIYEYSRHHTHQQTLEELHGAFGTRGERVAAIYTEDGAIGRQENFRRSIAATPGAAAQQQALSETPMQHFEQAVARAGDVMNTLATAVLPAVDQLFKGAVSGLSDVNSHLQGHPNEAIGADDRHRLNDWWPTAQRGQVACREGWPHSRGWGTWRRRRSRASRRCGRRRCRDRRHAG